MSKIQSIQPNYQQKRGHNGNKMSYDPQFGAASLTTAEKNLVDKTLTKDYLGVKGRALGLLSSTAGEIQNLWVMNVGTAFVAPFFIANNPLSHEDKKSKEYTAWRQPISAVISLTFGLALNIVIPNYVEKQAVKGKLQAFDMSAMPPSGYLKGIYKGINKHFANLKGDNKKFFDMINEDGSIKTQKDFKDKFMNNTNFETAVHKVTLERAGKNLLDKKNPSGLYNITLKDFLADRLGFEVDYVNKLALNPEATKSKLSKTHAMEFLRAIGYSNDDVNETSLRTFINNNIYKDKVGFNPHEKKYITRVGESLVPEELKQSETITMKHLLKTLGLDKGFGANEKLLNTKMDQFILQMREMLDIDSAVASAKSGEGKKLSKVIIKSSEEFLQKHAAQIAKNIAQKAAKNYGAYKKVQGITLSLATLPVSCGLLNWSYPRIMEKCFPNLCKKPDSAVSSKGGK